MKDTLLIILVVAVLGVIPICTGIVVYAMMDIGRRIDILTEEAKNLRLKSRARVAQASMQSGARTEEQDLVRAGRAAEGKRRVVGGDEESEQYKRLRGGGGQDESDPND